MNVCELWTKRSKFSLPPPSPNYIFPNRDFLFREFCNRVLCGECGVVWFTKQIAIGIYWFNTKQKSRTIPGNRNVKEAYWSFITIFFDVYVHKYSVFIWLANMKLLSQHDPSKLRGINLSVWNNNTTYCSIIFTNLIESRKIIVKFT
jgi:hypothetical protein